MVIAFVVLETMSSLSKTLRPLSTMSRGQRMLMLALNKEMQKQSSHNLAVKCIRGITKETGSVDRLTSGHQSTRVDHPPDTQPRDTSVNSANDSSVEMLSGTMMEVQCIPGMVEETGSMDTLTSGHQSTQADQPPARQAAEKSVNPTHDSCHGETLLGSVEVQDVSGVDEETGSMDSQQSSEDKQQSVNTGQRRKRCRTSPSQRKRMKLEQMRANHGVLPPCHSECKRKCNGKFSEEQRVKLNAEFWQLNWYNRKLFVINTCKRKPVSRRTAGPSQRSVTVSYFLDNGTEPVSVCKAFYLTTLGYIKTNDFFVHHALKSVITGECCIAPKPDGRGKTPASNRVDRAVIKNHTESYHPCVSHYRRQHAPHRRYLPSDISVRSMYDDFVSRHGKICSYDLYRKEVKEMHISFTRLGHEECEQCEAFAMHNRDHTQDNLCDSCDLCHRWKAHIEKAKRSRCEYDKDRDTQETINPVYSADLQKVIMIPRMESFKSVVFTRRIIALNESFVPVGTKSSCLPMAVLWHEGIAGRKKEDITSAFHSFFLHRRDQKLITLWLDNCSAQNKNWALFSFLIYIINSPETITDVIRLKYFEPGHTFMSADSFHHQVEKSLQARDKVYDFNDYVSCVQSSNSGKVTTKPMQAQDFSDWPDCSSTYKLNRQVPRPLLSDMVFVEARRGHNILVYRTDFDGPDIVLNFLNARAAKSGIAKPVCRTTPRGIPLNKKNDILVKLGPLMPQNRQQFWQNIPTSADVSDLVNDVSE